MSHIPVALRRAVHERRIIRSADGTQSPRSRRAGRCACVPAASRVGIHARRTVRHIARHLVVYFGGPRRRALGRSGHDRIDAAGIPGAGRGRRARGSGAALPRAALPADGVARGVAPVTSSGDADPAARNQRDPDKAQERRVRLSSSTCSLTGGARAVERSQLLRCHFVVPVLPVVPPVAPPVVPVVPPVAPPVVPVVPVVPPVAPVVPPVAPVAPVVPVPPPSAF